MRFWRIKRLGRACAVVFVLGVATAVSVETSPAYAQTSMKARVIELEQTYSELGTTARLYGKRYSTLRKRYFRNSNEAQRCIRPGGRAAVERELGLVGSLHVRIVAQRNAARKLRARLRFLRSIGEGRPGFIALIKRIVAVEKSLAYRGAYVRKLVLRYSPNFLKYPDCV